MSGNREYKRTEILGKGTYGVAYLAYPKHNPNEKCVIKAVDLEGFDEKDAKGFLLEAKLFEEFNHPYIVGYKDHFIGQDTKLYIVTEFANGGDLQQFVRAAKKRGDLLPEDIIWSFLVQLCLAIKHVHDRKILHRDIKTANIFLAHSQTKEGMFDIKLGDFGISKVLEHTQAKAKSSVGTPYYMSPELCGHKHYDNKSDMWAIGCVAYELCTLKNPFDAKNFHALCAKIMKGKYSPISSHYSRDLHNFVDILLARKPEDRLNVNELLQTPWMAKRLSAFQQEHPDVANEELAHTVLHGFKPLSGQRPSFSKRADEADRTGNNRNASKPSPPAHDSGVVQPPGSSQDLEEVSELSEDDSTISVSQEKHSDGLNAAARGEKFTYNGKTLNLPGASEDETIYEKVERLRLFLEEKLGADIFLKVYRIMQAIDRDTDEDRLEADLVAIVGFDNIEYLNVVCQLIFAEDSATEEAGATVTAE